jgi:HAD superfamily hydrolase (TIGR01490 family)
MKDVQADTGIEVANRYAFFDVDETLISIKSMFDFMPFWCERYFDSGLQRRFNSAFASARQDHQSREQLNRLYYSFFENASMAELTVAGKEWFEDRFKVNRPPYIRSVVARLRVHLSDGVRPVFISGSMLPLLQPLSEELGVEHCLCTQLVVDEHGRLTGAIQSPQTIGLGKATALKTFVGQSGARVQDCYAYGDDISDLPMLEAVGMPVAVGASAELAAVAKARSWERLAV